MHIFSALRLLYYFSMTVYIEYTRTSVVYIEYTRTSVVYIEYTRPSGIYRIHKNKCCI